MGLKKKITKIFKGNQKAEPNNYNALEERNTAESNIYSGLNQVSQKEVFKDYSQLVKKIQQGEITLEDLNALTELGDSKKFFLKDVEDIISNNSLHELNKKVMEHALDLADFEDSAFLLRGSNKGIFRDLFYLEAKNNNWTISINDKKTLTFDLSDWLLELYQSLTVNFYEKNFEDIELQQTYHSKCYTWIITPFEKLSDEQKEVIKESYINKSLAQSLMFLFISNFFKQDIVKNADVNELTSLADLEKELNNPENVYIKKLEILNILSCLDHPAYNKVTPLESIEILGDNMTFATLV